VTGVPNFAWMSADQVADQAVRAVGRGPVLVNGAMNSVVTSLVRVVPRSVTSRLVAAFLRPKEA
jgi:short-subunit dehydrogenase